MSARIIHHFEVSPGEIRQDEVPVGSKILCALAHNGGLRLYVEKPMICEAVALLTFTGIGTGWEFDPNDLDYIGTVSQGAFVWSVYAKVHQ